jgi:hypothetical protein
LDGKISTVLATIDANTETLSKLKLMFGKFMENVKEFNNGSFSESKSAAEHRNGAPVHTVQGQAVLKSSLPKLGSDGRNKDMNLETGSPSKDLVEGVFVATCTTNEAPTNCGKSIVIETIDLANSFLNFSSASASEAHDDIVAAKALARISSPTFEEMVDKNSGQPKMAPEGKKTVISKESSQSDAKKQGNGEEEADPYAMDPSPNKQWNPALQATKVIFI